MVKAAPPKTLIFLHIPKTGGTTLSRVVARQYSQRSLFAIDGADIEGSIEDLAGMEQERKRAIRYIHGHVSFGIHSLLSGPVTYITLVRDPVERLISHYWHAVTVRNHYLHDLVADGRMSLYDYVRSDASPEISNGQTKAIAGIAAGPGEPEQADTALLELAKRNICVHFAAVGVSERFDESLMLLRSIFGWKKVFYFRENVTRGRPRRGQFSLETVKAIEARNLLDRQLHEFATARLEKAVREQGPSFERQLRAFRALNAVVGLGVRATALWQRGRAKFIRRSSVEAKRVPKQVF